MNRYMTRRILLLCLACYMTFTLLVVELALAAGLLGSESGRQKRADTLRQATRATVTEGDILDRNGLPLTGQPLDTGTARPLAAESLGRILGFKSAAFGTAGLRKAYNEQLYSASLDGKGCTLQTTLDLSLQNLAYQLCQTATEDECAEIILLSADTGAVLAMASMQYGLTYPAEEICRYSSTSGSSPFEAEWPSGFWMDRCTTDAYQACSTMKLASAALILKQKLNESFYDEGSFLGIHNAQRKAYGQLNLAKAVLHSVNTYFGAKTVEAGPQAAMDNLRAFGYEVPCAIPDLDVTLNAQVNEQYATLDGVLAQVGFGYCTSISPLMVAMQYGSLANGSMMYPYLVDSVTAADGTVSQLHESAVFSTPFDEETRQRLVEIFSANAAAYGVQADNFQVLGCKTGTDANSVWMAACVRHDTGASFSLVVHVHNQTAAARTSKSLSLEVNQMLQALSESIGTSGAAKE